MYDSWVEKGQILKPPLPFSAAGGGEGGGGGVGGGGGGGGCEGQGFDVGILGDLG